MGSEMCIRDSARPQVAATTVAPPIAAPAQPFVTAEALTAAISPLRASIIALGNRPPPPLVGPSSGRTGAPVTTPSTHAPSASALVLPEHLDTDLDYDEEEDDVLDIHPNAETLAEFDAHEATQTHPSLTPQTVQSYGVQPSIPLHQTD